MRSRSSLHESAGHGVHPTSNFRTRLRREKRAKAQRRATNSAAGMVSCRPHSERELRTKLAEREHDPDAIDAAVQRLQELVRIFSLPKFAVHCNCAS